jgi:transcriptional regulator of acetoin/glycerol metabolism
VLRQQIDSSWGLGALVGSSEPVACASSWSASRTRAPDLAGRNRNRGERGAALHEVGWRRGRFLAINCAAPDAPDEPLLFGRAGAFTEQPASRGQFSWPASTLLDEVAEMPPSFGPLLRAIDDKKYLPLGSDREPCARA